MITPVMISNIGWGTYLFFALVNASFIPFIYFFYPETKKRSLEEIDLIFAKGYLENISYVKAAEEMPFLSDHEIDEMARKYGFVGADEEVKTGDKEELTEAENTPEESATNSDTEAKTKQSKTG
jgi:hypothetical protein